MTTMGQLLRSRLKKAAEAMAASTIDQHGGLIYFPQTRHPFSTSLKAGVIEPQPQTFEWLPHVATSDQWNGSLEALWVWQNYLDLEARASNVEDAPNHLQPFIEVVEDALGSGRKINIHYGRVWVQTNWEQFAGLTWVRLDQLPSGERQLLFLLGELARYRRSGAVIMIDEPEPSLHPSLQRMLVYKLMKLAQAWNCQLILATHSLEIMRSVHASKLINLDHLDHYDRHLEAYAETAA